MSLGVAAGSKARCPITPMGMKNTFLQTTTLLQVLVLASTSRPWFEPRFFSSSRSPRAPSIVRHRTREAMCVLVPHIEAPSEDAQSRAASSIISLIDMFLFSDSRSVRASCYYSLLRQTRILCFATCPFPLSARLYQADQFTTISPLCPMRTSSLCSKVQKLILITSLSS